MKRFGKVLLTGLLFVGILFFAAGCSCNGDNPPENLKVYNEVDGVVIETDIENSKFAKLVKDIEAESYYFITETKTGKAIAKAYQKLKDGSEVLINDFSNFLLDSNIASIRLETQDAISIEQFTLNYSEFKGYWIGKTFSFQIEPKFYPQEPTNSFVKYFSSDTSIATVNHNGLVTIKNKGTVTISALTLEGEYKASCMVKIIDGTTQLKDSAGYVDYEKYELIANRFDDLTNEKSVYKQISLSDKTNYALIGGEASNGSSGTYVSLMYGRAYQSSTSFDGNNVQLDPSNEYSQENLFDIEYNPINGKFYILTINRTPSVSNTWKTILYTFEEQYDNLTNTYYLTNKTTHLLDGIHYQTTFVGETAYCWSVSSNGTLQCYNIENGTFYDLGVEVDDINNAYRDEENNRFVLCGDSSSRAYIAIVNNDLTDVSIAYSTVVGTSTFYDVTWINESHIVAVGGGYKSNAQGVALIQSFILNNDTLETMNYKLVESETDTEINYFSNVYYENGYIGVIGTTSWTATADDFWGSLFGKKENYMGGTVSVFTTSLQFVSGKKYFNMQKDTGKLSVFQNALSLGNGTYVCVGKSNYKTNEDLSNGYIQYNIELFK